MTFDPTLAAIRFGTGLSPDLAPPASANDMLTLLAGADLAALSWPVPQYDDVRPSLMDLRQMSRAARESAGTASETTVDAAYDAMRGAVTTAHYDHFKAIIARGISTTDGLRERLTLFWADHFTVRSKIGITDHLVTPFVETAIRPHVGGRFGDMLVAVTTHPEMLRYLDQTNSMGPHSPRARRQDRGLNENLARELLELHTVGVDGPYGQRDVRQMAELLTGLGWTQEDGMIYRPDHAEPGAETVMGTTYSDQASLATITDALHDLAVHPATAAHIAHKLAVHFVSDTPDPALVAALTARFSETRGDLLAVTEALLNHPAAFAPAKAKVKPPFDFIVSALRALGIGGEAMLALDGRDLRRWFFGPLTVMGQPWEEPAGPDGWPEAPEAWITPQGMAGRINWAMRVPRALMADMPDPRDFVQTALGPNADQNVVFAASAAEDRAEGVGVVLASADFQRR